MYQKWHNEKTHSPAAVTVHVHGGRWSGYRCGIHCRLCCILGYATFSASIRHIHWKLPTRTTVCIVCITPTLSHMHQQQSVRYRFKAITSIAFQCIWTRENSYQFHLALKSQNNNAHKQIALTKFPVQTRCTIAQQAARCGCRCCCCCCMISAIRTVTVVACIVIVAITMENTFDFYL